MPGGPRQAPTAARESVKVTPASNHLANGLSAHCGPLLNLHSSGRYRGHGQETGAAGVELGRRENDADD
jgi:hypothetical protein